MVTRFYPLDDTIENLIKQATNMLGSTSNYHLPPFIRDQIYNCFEPQAKRRKTHPSAWLSLVAARYVLPILEDELKKVYITSNPTWEPGYMLSVGEEVLMGNLKITSRLFAKISDRAYHASGSAWGQDSFTFPWHAQLAGYAMDSTLGSISGSDPFYRLRCDRPLRGVVVHGKKFCLDSSLTDDDLTPYMPGASDAACLASKAYTLVNPEVDLKPIYNADKRREFWMWWLTDAVPQAWDMAYWHTTKTI